MPRYKFQRQDILTKDEVAKMIEQAETPGLKALIAFLYLFGCRVSEALNVTKDDVKIYDKTMTVRLLTLKRKEHGAVVPSRKDTAKLTSPFVEVFLAHLGMVSEGKIWRMSRVTAWRKIKKLNPQCSPHIFRHTRATKFAEVTENAFVMQDWFGWADLNTALKYIHLSGRGAAKLADKID